METFDDIFKKFGGTGSVAKAIDVGHSTASEMRRRRSIPVKYWPALIEAASELKDIRLDTDTLVRLHIEATSAPSEQGAAA